MVKKYLLFAFLYCLNSLYASAQTHEYHGTDTKWYEGSVVLSDGTELTGLIRNNEKGGVISYKEKANEKTFESFRAASILSLEYFDIDRGIARKFYSLSTTNANDGIEDIFLFEILREFEHFAVLSLLGKTTGHETKEIIVPMIGVGGLPTPSTIPGKEIFMQTEEIYFMNEDGKRELYMLIEHRDVDASIYKYKTDKGKVDDPSLPSRYMSNSEWTEVTNYVKRINLKVDNKEKLLTLLDYYATLVNR